MNKGYARLGLLGASCVVAVLGGIAGFAQGQQDPAPKPRLDKKLVERGKYLTTMMGCKECHSPLGPDGKLVPGFEFSGHPENVPLPKWEPSMIASHNSIATFALTGTAFAGPWGTSVAGNLTPDDETGIGKLTYDELLKSFRTYKHWKFEKRPVLPPMPNLGEASDDDIKAIYHYLMSLKAIKNKPPLSIVAGPPADK